MTRTFVILDGIQDTDTARGLSARWARAGFRNVADMSGQCAWLSPGPSESDPGSSSAIDEAGIDRVGDIARSFGLGLRDRVGNTFKPDNDLDALRAHTTKEYRSRFASGLVFGFPAVVLHYLGPVLAGGVEGPGSLAYPWLIELLLVGWGCFGPGWPILWQGVMSIRHGRFSSDALTALIVIVGFVPSAWGVVSLLVVDRPWFMSRDGNDILAGGGGPAFHTAMLTIVLALFQRWMVYRSVDRLAGRADLMIPRWNRVVGMWGVLSGGVMVLGGWQMGLAVGMLLPAMGGIGGISRWAVGWSGVLPVFGFAMIFLLGPGVLMTPIRGVESEIAFGFGVMMSASFVAGWMSWPRVISDRT